MVDRQWGAYFDRLCDRIASDRTPDPMDYDRVLWHLHTTPFHSEMRMDNNRISDALVFREMCGMDIRNAPVCVLELMVSLANRIETDIMGGTVDRDRTGEWFWEMMASLGLIRMTDENYNEQTVSLILARFILREHDPDGRGGLFTVSDPHVDLRQYEIWYQAALYLNEVLRAEGVLDP